MTSLRAILPLCAEKHRAARRHTLQGQEQLTPRWRWNDVEAGDEWSGDALEQLLIARSSTLVLNEQTRRW